MQHNETRQSSFESHGDPGFYSVKRTNCEPPREHDASLSLEKNTLIDLGRSKKQEYIFFSEKKT